MLIEYLFFYIETVIHKNIDLNLINSYLYKILKMIYKDFKKITFIEF